MGIRLKNSTAPEKTEQKTESESLPQVLESSVSNPVPAPEAAAQPVAPPVERAPAELSAADMDQALQPAKEPVPGEISAADLDDAVDYGLHEPAAKLDSSAVLARYEDPNKNKQLRDIQEQYKVNPDQAMALISQYGYEGLKAKPKYKNLTHDYPAISKWAQNPANMKLMEQDPDAFKKIEESSKMLGYFGDFGKVALQNVYTIPMMGLHAAVSTGTVSIEDAAPMMEKLQANIDANQITYNKKGMTEIGQGMAKLTKGLNEILPYKFSDSKGDVTMKSLGKIAEKIDMAVNNRDYAFLTRMYKRFKGTDTGLLDFLGAMVTNPSASLLMAGQSAYSIAPGMVAPMAGAAVGGALTAGNPIGVAAGAVSASYATGFAVSYGQFFQEESDKFKDPKTGKVDFRKMYSDPKVLARMQSMALKYATAHGAFEAIGGKLLGRTFHGAANAAKGSKLLALGVETLEQAASEGGGEFTAKLATGKSIGESASEGVAEAAFSVPYTPGAAMLQALNLARIENKANKKKKDAPPAPPAPPSGDGKPPAGPIEPPPVRPLKNKNEIFKVIGEKLEADKALRNREIVTEMRATKESSPAVKESPQQVQDLIKEASNPTAEIGQEDGVTIEGNIGEDTTVSFDVNQFEDLAQTVGEDPLKMAEHLGPNGVAAYIAAKKNDTGVFQVTADEYHRYSDLRPELDDIMYVNDAEMNAVEGKQTAEMATELEKLMQDNADISLDEKRSKSDIMADIDSVLQELEQLQSSKNPDQAKITEAGIRLGKLQEEYNGFGNDAPDGWSSVDTSVESDIEIGGGEDIYTTYEPTSADENLGDLVSRPVALLQASRTKADRVVFADLVRKLKAILKESQAHEGVAEAMAELELSHLRFRAETTGRKIGDLAAEMSLGFRGIIPGAYGQMKLDKGIWSPILKVVFSKTSATSTVIHEFAHSWLHNMVMDYDTLNDNLERTEIQEDYYQAMIQVAKMFEVGNVKDIYKLPEPEWRRVHETFAQTAEKYFLDGDMQNNTNRRIFKLLQGWMAKIAEHVNRLNRPYPTLKLNPDIERMFRTILDANREAEDRVVEMFPDPLFTADMVGDKADKYIKAIKDARDEAVAQMYSKFFNESLREREKKIDAALDGIYDKAAGEVEELPAIKLMNLIKAGGNEAKITYQSILDHLAGGSKEVMEQIKSMLAPGIMAPNKRGGADVRDVMAALNINNKEDFISMLGQMKMKDTLIEQRANQLMDEMFPALKTDAEMHAEAVKAIQESGREKILNIEMEILAEKHMETLKQMNEDAVKSPFSLKRKTMKALKEIGFNRVLQSGLKNFRASDFLKVGARFNKQAASFVRQGDYLAAFDSKQKEAVNTFAFLEALKAVKELNRILTGIKKLKKLSPMDIGKNFDFDIYNAAKEFVAEFEGKQLLSDPSEVKGVGSMSEVGQEIIGRLVQAINANISMNADGNYSVETLLNLGKLVDLMRFEARKAKEIDIAGKKADLRETLTTIIGEMTSDDNVLSFEGKKRYEWRSGIPTVTNLFAGLMDEAKFAGSAILGKVLAAVDRAQNTLIKNRNQDEDTLANGIKKISKNNPEAQSILKQLRDSTYSLFGVEVGKPVAAPEIDHTFSNKGELYKLLATMMSESGRRKVAEGGLKSKGKDAIQVDINQVDAMFDRMFQDGTLKKADVDFVQLILDLFERHFPHVKEAVREVHGFEIDRITARPLVTPWGEYKGGYIPLKRGEDITKTFANAFNTIETSKEFIPDFYPVTNKSMTIARDGSAYPVNLDLGTLKSELSAVHRIAYMLPAMHQIGKILGHPEFVGALEKRRPGAMRAIVTPWFKKTMAQQYVERIDADKTFAKPLERVVQVLTDRARKSIFLFNYLTWGKQYIGLIPAMSNLSPIKISNATMRSFLSPIGSRDAIKAQSPLMAERFETNARNVLRSLEDFSLNDTWFDRGNKLTEKMTYFPIQLAQNHVDTIVWTAAFETAKTDLKLSGKQAIDYADSYVVRTQTTNNVSGLPALRSGNVFQKALTTFSNVPIGMAGMQMETKGRAKGKSNPKFVAMMANAYLLTSILPAILAGVVSMPGAGLKMISGDDDDKDEYLSSLSMRAASEGMDSIFPISAQNIFGLYGGITGDDRFAQVGIVPLSNQLVEAARGSKALYKNALGMATDEEYGREGFTDRDLRSLAIGFSLMTDIPVGAIPFTFSRAEKTSPSEATDQQLEDIFSDLDLSQ